MVTLLTGLSVNTSAQSADPNVVLVQPAGTFSALQEVWGVDVFSSASGWTAAQLVQLYQRAGFSISTQDAQTIIDFETAGNIQASEDFSNALFSDIIASASHGSDTRDSSQVTFNLIQSSIFEKVAPMIASREEEEESGGAAMAGKPMFGADVFYGVTDFDLFGEVKTYGANLSLAWGNETQFKTTLPVYHSDFGGSDATTYGLDLNVRHRASESTVVGAHANYLSTDLAGGSSESSTLGVYGAYITRLKDETVLTLGALFDYATPDVGSGALVGAVAANLGFVVGEHTSFNPYSIYFRNFETDADWIDVGAEFQVNISSTWAINVGAKTSLEQQGVDSNYQIYLGSAFQF
ncbi:MAG: hypothetical protein SynsKO_28710 [Synoicihabitans sp.]